MINKTISNCPLGRMCCRIETDNKCEYTNKETAVMEESSEKAVPGDGKLVEAAFDVGCF